MTPIVVVAAIVAGSLGAVIRYGTARAFAAHPSRLPWAVLIVNVVGSLIGGVVLGLAQTGAWSADARLIVLSGFCGGLTTFSTFSVETIQLTLEGRTRAALASVLVNLVLGIGAATLGWWLTTALLT